MKPADLDRLDELLKKLVAMGHHAAEQDTPLLAIQRAELWDLLVLLDLERAHYRMTDFWMLLQDNQRLRKLMNDIVLAADPSTPAWQLARQALTEPETKP
jgi:hypothetical protein